MSFIILQSLESVPFSIHFILNPLSTVLLIQTYIFLVLHLLYIRQLGIHLSLLLPNFHLECNYCRSAIHKYIENAGVLSGHATLVLLTQDLTAY